ncbi:hypothetical protein QQP08_022379, partial [Theobroma cacao]
VFPPRRLKGLLGLLKFMDVNRNFILLNTRHQPIGPINEGINNLSIFLGTLVRNPMLAPLVKFDIEAQAKKRVLILYITDDARIKHCPKGVPFKH